LEICETLTFCVPDVVHTSAELPHLHCHIQYIYPGKGEKEGHPLFTQNQFCARWMSGTEVVSVWHLCRNVPGNCP